MSLALPNVDPSLYISRFAALLEFGDETQKVAADAVRLVARMSRDWMHIGRRPAGVCGACLLLAARMNNFRRSITEVVQVVKIADVTLRKRLGEFKETASGGLTVDEFRTLWLDEVSDPPAFARSQKKEKLEREKLENARSVKEGTEDKEGRNALSDVANQMSGGDDEDGDDDSSPMKASQSPSLSSLGKRKQQDSDDDDEEDTEAETAAKEKQKISDKYLEHTSVEHGIANEVNTALGSTTGRALTTVLDTNESVRKIKAASMTNLFELNTSERLDDLNEAELEVFILTPEEVEAKSRLWMEFNKEYLQTLAGALSLLLLSPLLFTDSSTARQADWTRWRTSTGRQSETGQSDSPSTRTRSALKLRVTTEKAYEAKRLDERSRRVRRRFDDSIIRQETILKEDQLRRHRGSLRCERTGDEQRRSLRRRVTLPSSVRKRHSRYSDPRSRAHLQQLSTGYPRSTTISISRAGRRGVVSRLGAEEAGRRAGGGGRGLASGSQKW